MILVTTQCFPPDVGGIQAYMAGIADAFARCGQSVLVFADAANAKAASEFDTTRHYPVYRFGGPRPWRRWRKARAITERMRRGGIRVVIADSWKSLEYISPDVLQNARVICIAHGAELLVRPGSAKEARIIKAFKKASVVAANSQFTANLVKPLIRGKTKVRAILPGVEAPPGASRELPARSRPASRHLITIARLEPHKGVDIVLQSLPELQKRHPDIVFDIVGDGYYRKQLIALANSLGVQNVVRFHGKVSEQLKADLLSQADVFVLANRLEPGEVEGFGVVFAEAAAFGLPCVAGREGGTGDAVITDETGLVVDGSSVDAVQGALTALLDDPVRARNMGLAGHTRFWSEFDWDVALARFEAALMELTE